MGWSISPNSATINNNGVASIPKNTGETDITYTITYVDSEGCSGRTTYVKQACPPEPPEPPVECECSSIVFISGETTESGREIIVSCDEQTVVIGTVPSDCEITTYGMPWATISNNGGNLELSVTKNSSESVSRTGGIPILICGEQCVVVTVIQAPTKTEYEYDIEAWFQHEAGDSAYKYTFSLSWPEGTPAGPRVPIVTDGWIRFIYINCANEGKGPVEVQPGTKYDICVGSSGQIQLGTISYESIQCNVRIGGSPDTPMVSGDPPFVYEDGPFKYTIKIKDYQNNSWGPEE